MTVATPAATTFALPAEEYRTTGPAAQEQPKRIGKGRLIAFSASGMPLAAVEVPLSTYVPPLYASAFGFSLATVGVIFLAARLWDAFIDPAIGILSDRTRSRWGRRKPWIAIGGVIFAAGAVPVFLPPVWFGPLGLSVALFVLYLGYSMIATPYAAWGGELSSAYHERTRITTYMQALTSMGLLLALVLPSLLVRELEGQPRAQLAAMGAMVFVLLAIGLPLGLRSLPEGPVPTGKQEPIRLAETLRLVFSEGPLLRVLASNFSVRLAQGVRTALFVFFVSYYMGKPHWAPALFLLQYIFGIFACPLWLAIGRRIGKERAAVAGELTQVTINLLLLLLTPSAVPLLLALTVAQGLAQGSGNLMLRAIVADVADYHRLKTGHDRIGLFFSVFSLSDKAGVAVAIGVVLPLAAWLGFDPSHANGPHVLEHLKWLFAAGPALGHIISAVLIFRFPIDEGSHGDIRRKLAARDAAGLVSDASRDRWIAQANQQTSQEKAR